MIVPVETRPVPLADSPDEIDEFLSQTASTEVPVFAVQDHWETHAEALAALEPHLATNGLVIARGKSVPFIHVAASGLRRRIGVSFRRVNYSGQTGLHTDLMPDRNAPPFESARIHTTEEGEVEARFYEPTGLYVARLLSRPLLRQCLTTDPTLALPKSVYEQLAENMVDDEVLIPVRYNITASPGTTIIFRSYGRRPVFHGFRDTVLPRISQVTTVYPREKAA